MTSDATLTQDTIELENNNLERPLADKQFILPSILSWKKHHKDFILITHYDAAAEKYEETNLGLTAKKLLARSPELLTDISCCYQHKLPLKKQGFYYLCCSDKKIYMLVTYIFIAPNVVTMCIEDKTHHNQMHKLLRGSRHKMADDTRRQNIELLKINKRITEEIAQHKITVQALRTQTLRNETLLKNSPDGFWIVDFNGHICEVNNACSKMYGYSKTELTSLNVDKIDAFETLDQVKTRIRRIRRNGSERFETTHRHKDGSLIDVEISVTMVKLEQDEYFFAFIRDITKRKRDQNTIKANETRLRLITDNLPVLISYVDKDYRFQFNNKTYQNWFHQSPSELLGKPVKELLGEEIFNNSLESYQQIFSGKTVKLEAQTLFPDGIKRCVDITYVPDFDSKRNVKGFVTLVSDVSKRKKLEQEARQQQQNLAHVSRISTINELTTGLAHEINQPLTAITNYSKAGLHWIENGNTEPLEYQNLLKKIIDQSERASNIIQHIRELIRKKRLQKISTNIEIMVENIIDLLAHDLHLYNVNLTTNLDENILFINVDAIQIQQVLLNLLKNSIEAMCRDNSCDACELYIVTEKLSHNSIKFTVADNGPGLPEENQEQVFQSFYTTKTSGLGLGLSVSRTIVEAHGGRIWAEPRLPAGTNFYFTLQSENSE